MTHEEVLNQILARACGTRSEEEVEWDGIDEYEIELHCWRAKVRARFLGCGEGDPPPIESYRFEVIGIEWEI